MIRNRVLFLSVALLTIPAVSAAPADPEKGAAAKDGKAAKVCVPANEADAYARALKFTATPEEKERLVALFQAASEQTPPRGDKDAWKKRNEGLVAAAKEFAAEKEPKKVAAARLKFSLFVNCIGCHLEHKAPGFTGFPDPQLGRIPDDVPAEFRMKVESPKLAFPAMEFPKLAFPAMEFPKFEVPKMGFPNGNFEFPNLNPPAVRETSAQEKAFGAALREPDEVLAEQLDLPRGQGIVVGLVQPESAAAKAGLKSNDILLELSGKPVPNNLDEFFRLAKEIRPNTPVDVLVVRKGKKETLKGLLLPQANR